MINDKDAPINKFKDLIDFEEKEFTQMNNAEKAQNHYNTFAEFECKLHRDAFLKLDFTINRDDMFIEKYLQKAEKYTVEKLK